MALTSRDVFGKGTMTSNRFATAALTLILAAGTGAFAQSYGQHYGAPYGQQYSGQNYGGQQGYGAPHDRDRDGWDSTPPEFREAQQRGFRDGIEGARKDFENHRPPNVNNRDEFRHPNFIQRPDRRDYRFGFQRGYDTAVRHMYGEGPARR